MSNRFFKRPVEDSRASLPSQTILGTSHSDAFLSEDIQTIHAEATVTGSQGTITSVDVWLETKTENGDWYSVRGFIGGGLIDSHTFTAPALATVTPATLTAGVAAVNEVQTVE